MPDRARENPPIADRRSPIAASHPRMRRGLGVGWGQRNESLPAPVAGSATEASTGAAGYAFVAGQFDIERLNDRLVKIYARAAKFADAR